MQVEIKRKEAAVRFLAHKYSHSNQPSYNYPGHSRHVQATKQPKFTQDEVETCIYSIADNHAYLRYNRDPVDKMIRLLQQFFKPSKVEAKLQHSSKEEVPLYSLAIREATSSSVRIATHDVAYCIQLPSRRIELTQLAF